MYLYLLSVHSWFRWFVLIGVLTLFVRSVYALKTRRSYTKIDKKLRQVTISIIHIQLMLGLCLYFISPQIELFFSNISEGLQLREARFFSIEHSLMMVIAVVLITIGAAKAKRKKEDMKKFKMIVVWFSIALLIILLNVPWEFSPLVSRPNFRLF